jgi:hypothetical protein
MEIDLTGDEHLYKNPVFSSLVVTESCGVFYKFSAGDLAVKQAACFVEFEEHFDALKAHIVSHQDLAADKIKFAVFVNFQAGVIVDVDLPMDDLSAAAAFHGEFVKRATVGGRR